jgi:hypothetical protein
MVEKCSRPGPGKDGSDRFIRKLQRKPVCVNYEGGEEVVV